MDAKNILLAKAAYKAAEPKTADRIPYDLLAPHWQKYWINVADAVVNELEKLK
jgi:hypothetical protein